MFIFLDEWKSLTERSILTWVIDCCDREWRLILCSARARLGRPVVGLPGSLSSAVVGVVVVVVPIVVGCCCSNCCWSCCCCCSLQGKTSELPDTDALVLIDFQDCPLFFFLYVASGIVVVSFASSKTLSFVQAQELIYSFLNSNPIMNIVTTDTKNEQNTVFSA